MKPEYKGKVALNGSPLTSGSARRRRLRGGDRERRLVERRRARASTGSRRLKSVGNFIPVQATPQTVASGQTPIVLDWDYLNLAYGKEFPAAKWTTTIPADGVYGAYYCQAVNATAPHPWAARLWQEFCYSDQGQILWLKGYAHPARFDDLAEAQGDSDGADQGAAVGGALREGEVREHRPAGRGEGA